MDASSVGITEIGKYIPENRESNYEKTVKFGIDDNFVRTKIGVEFVSRKPELEETSDMCVKAFIDLQSKCSVHVSDVDCLIVVTQNPDNYGIPHTSAIVHNKLGCSDHCAAFDISLGCSGYVYSLSVAISFMQQNGLRTGLLFTADPYSKILNVDDKNTSLLFGDASTVTLLTPRAEFYARKFRFGTRGSGGDSLFVQDNILQMNGRSVFNFSAVEVPMQIRDLLSQASLDMHDVDLLLLHQGSKSIIDAIQRRMQVEGSKVPTNLQAQGNTVSSSIPLLLSDYLHVTQIRRLLLSGFGVGLSWASAILERR